MELTELNRVCALMVRQNQREKEMADGTRVQIVGIKPEGIMV